MQLKSIENLSDYLLTENGGVVVKSTFELLPVPDKKGYPLKVDEVAHLPLTKKDVRLVRRFSVDDIQKLYASPKAIIYKEEAVRNVENIPYTDKDMEEVKPIKEKVSKTIKASEVGLKKPYVIYGDVPYASARKASAATGVSINTLLRRCKENKDGNFYIEADGK